MVRSYFLPYCGLRTLKDSKKNSEPQHYHLVLVPNLSLTKLCLNKTNHHELILTFRYLGEPRLTDTGIWGALVQLFYWTLTESYHVDHANQYNQSDLFVGRPWP